MLDIPGRVIRQHKGRINKVVEELEVTWPTNLQQEIVEGMKTAEKEVLKTIEGIGMIPGLRAANVVFQNQRTGDLTMLNSAATAFVSETFVRRTLLIMIFYCVIYRKTALQPLNKLQK